MLCVVRYVLCVVCCALCVVRCAMCVVCLQSNDDRVVLIFHSSITWFCHNRVFQIRNLQEDVSFFHPIYTWARVYESWIVGYELWVAIDHESSVIMGYGSRGLWVVFMGCSGLWIMFNTGFSISIPCKSEPSPRTYNGECVIVLCEIAIQMWLLKCYVCQRSRYRLLYCT